MCTVVLSHIVVAEPRVPTSSDLPFVEVPASRETLERLRQGGYVLYMRHGYTDNSRGDQEEKIDLSNCATQRVLSDAGRKLMRSVGQSVKTAGIPIGEIVVSPMCRTRESAELAFHRPYTENLLLMYWTRMSPAEKQPRLEELKRLLSAPVTRGTNRLLLAHAPNMQDLMGFFVKPEGSILVFSPKGAGAFEYAASIHPGMWEGLLAGL